MYSFAMRRCLPCLPSDSIVTVLESIDEAKIATDIVESVAIDMIDEDLRICDSENFAV